MIGMSNRPQAYQQLRPCIDGAGHRFVRGNPPAGMYGYAIIFCERCGMTSKEARDS